MRTLLALLPLLLLVSAASSAAAAPQPADPTAATFGELRLVDEVVAGTEGADHRFTESDPGVSEVREILGKPTRIIPNTRDSASYVTLRLGEGKGLQAKKAYVLHVDYPEDAPRTMVIHNRGAETTRGLYTGKTVGDVLKGRYVYTNPESLDYPLSGKHEPFQMLFYLQESMFDLKIPREEKIPRTLKPQDGIAVVISQWKAQGAPLSEGSAYSRIALYEVVDPSKLALQVNYPPQGLPRRHLFWREEMSDGIVNGADPGWANDTDWYESKAKVMQFLGMNTYSIDMLEFGHNQGWDTAPAGGNWMNASKSPQRWEKVLKMLAAGGYDFTVMPYYEYAGSVGGDSPGTKKLARPLTDIEAYTHITWSEKAYADVTEPAILEDAKKVLDLTIARWKDVMPFTGAWIRPRPSHMPVSFSDNALAKFAKEQMNGQTVTREQLRAGGELYDRYLAWWQDQRKAFLVALRDHLRSQIGDDALVFFTADASEPGVPLGGEKLVTDDVPTWTNILDTLGVKMKPVPLKQVVAEDAHLQTLLAPRPTWGKWELQHSIPSIDPQNYKDVDGVVPSYTFNRMYTVGSPRAFDAFRTPSGLGMVRHYCLNENEMDDKLGYVVVDMDRTGAHQMHAEVVAMANGDPWYIGYLAGHVFNRGFPHHARRFNQAYLALPALPSEVVRSAASDRDVVVRAIKTDAHGTWLAVANTGMSPKPGVTIKLPARGAVTDAATNQPLETAGDTLKLDLDAAELRAIHIR